jgi:hypothetical protein
MEEGEAERRDLFLEKMNLTIEFVDLLNEFLALILVLSL